MTLQQLIDAFRWEANDSGKPCFWTNPVLAQLASEGEREACRRGQYITDSTHSMCSLDVVPGEPLMELDKRIVSLRRVRLALGSAPLLPIASDALDLLHGAQWESHTGTPSLYVTDYQHRCIRLYPSPSVADTLFLSVHRMPLADLVNDDDEPEIRYEAHPALVQWMLYRAYARQDADTFDPQKSLRALAEFEREFGKKVSARNEEWARAGAPIEFSPIA